ncbi:MAG TPA: hypothetical protein VF870_13990 [Ignavibacteriaceae bacterium]
MLIDVEDLRAAILEKFGTQHNFAKKTGYAEPQITRAMQTQSPRFMLACKRAGIDTAGLLMRQREKEELKKLKVNDPQRRIMELEQLVKDQKEIIDLMKKVLERVGIDKKNK